MSAASMASRIFGSVTSGTVAPLGFAPRTGVGRWPSILPNRPSVHKGFHPHSSELSVEKQPSVTGNLSVDKPQPAPVRATLQAGAGD